MAVTDDPELAARIRQMSLHGLSQDAWRRFSGGAQWDYRIEAPGYKYNMTDVAAAIGIHQLQRAETMRVEREQIANFYLDTWKDLNEVELPARPDNRLHSWHLFPIRLRLNELQISRNDFIDELRQQGVGCSVHWRPLHLHPYYEETFGWSSDAFPVATREWERLISLPLFPGMTPEEQSHVAETVRKIVVSNRVTTCDPESEYTPPQKTRS